MRWLPFRTLLGTIALAALPSLSLWPQVATAAVPTATTVEGVLFSSGGQPAADGTYAMTFAIYPAASGGQAVWSEGPVQVAVKNGQLSHALGSAKPLSPQLFAGLQQAFLGLQVESDAELPRKALYSVPFSLRTAVAEGLDCSGCVTLAHLDAQVLAPYAKKAELAKVALSGNYGDLQGIPDLSGFAKAASLAKIAQSGQYADLLGAPDLTAYAKVAALKDVAFSGAYADLSGGPKLGTACGTGLVVKGLKADGSLDCVAALDPTALPPDSLNEVSNQLLTNQFTDVIAAPGMPLAIPDNSPLGVSSVLDVPDLGLAQGLSVSVTLTTSDVGQVKLVLHDPTGQKYVLHDKSGTGKSLSLTWPPAKTVSGDLTAWVGKNPKGKWALEIIDTGFLDNGTDGQVTAWSVQVDTLSSKKVAAGGAFQFHNATTPPVPCTAGNFGVAYANPSDKALYVCNGKDYAAVYLTVPGSKENPAFSCKDLLSKVPSTKDGNYWIDGSGGDPADAKELYCDMTGGGWTRVLVDDFESSTAGWSLGTVTSCGGLGKILGGYNVFAGGCFNKAIDVNVAHTDAKVTLSYIALDSSDGESGYVQVDGNTKWSQTLNNCGWGVGTNYCGNSPPCHGDTKYDVTINTAHTGAKLTLNICSSLDQGPSDESIGADNVVLWVK